jgi:drug/metabolite transporter (DMT)-like permease
MSDRINATMGFIGVRTMGEPMAMNLVRAMMGVLIHSVARRVLPPRYTVLFVLMSFFGVALVVTKGKIAGLLREPQHYAANALILRGMAFWMIYTFGAARFTTWSVLKYTTMTMWLGLTTSIAINVTLLAIHVVPLPNASDLIAIVPHLFYMSLIASFIGVLCWNFGSKILTPMNSVLFMDVVPITAFIVSVRASPAPH